MKELDFDEFMKYVKETWQKPVTVDTFRVIAGEYFYTANCAEDAVNIACAHNLINF
jgi:hypothetical protein